VRTQSTMCWVGTNLLLGTERKERRGKERPPGRSRYQAATPTDRDDRTSIYRKRTGDLMLEQRSRRPLMPPKRRHLIGSPAGGCPQRAATRVVAGRKSIGCRISPAPQRQSRR
jgi:hypothetical protein